MRRAWTAGHPARDGGGRRATGARAQAAPWETKRPRWTKQTTEGAWITFTGPVGPAWHPN